jgi:hypothetical protein
MTMESTSSLSSNREEFDHLGSVRKILQFSSPCSAEALNANDIILPIVDSVTEKSVFQELEDDNEMTSHLFQFFDGFGTKNSVPNFSPTLIHN